MPRAIADSDDEEDEVFIDHNEAQSETVSPQNREITAPLDSAANKSTGSTERLRREIRHAELRLADINGTGPLASESPSIPATKRRSTAEHASESSNTASRSAKRAKTLITYSNIHQNLTMHDGTFTHSQGDAVELVTSQSAHFTEHSAAGSSAALPSGSIQADFLNHEPHVLFRETGSTIADGSSVEPLLNQALGNKQDHAAYVMDALKPDPLQSSSVPFTVSEQGNSAKSDSKHKGAANATAVNVTPGENEFIQAEVDMHPRYSTSETHSTNEQSRGKSEKGSSKPPCSPTVEIQRNESTSRRSTRKSSTTSGDSAKGRKRKTPEANNTDPLNSDEIAIGLPKERYQPRPSRRRATEIDEEPMDYSVRPEKAAKVKRVKSLGANADSVAIGSSAQHSATDDGSEKLDQAPSKSLPMVKKRANSKSVEANQEANGQACSQYGNQSVAEETSKQQSADPAPNSAEDGETESFIKPPKPTPKHQSKSKTKRAHTTIFEDHVEFVSSQRSPNLSQQQASRKSALTDVRNEATTAKRKRKNVVCDDEDESDAEGTQDLTPNSPRKKRGRGRPPKAKSAEKVLEDSDEEDGENSIEPQEDSKKRGRGRPSKLASTVATTKEKEDEPDSVLQTESADEQQARRSEEREAAEVVSGVDDCSKERDTPAASPEKDGTVAKTAKPSPTSHSPIKSSSGVPLRVGLSKRHRIPSLLRVVRPPKR